MASCWREWGENYDYFNSAEDAQAFYDELAFMLVNQMAAPNSPQWFNTGLNSAYGITGPAQGHYYVDNDSGEVRLSEDAYTHPQPHACQPYDALISTPAGPVRIGDIVTGNRVGLEVYDGTGRWRGHDAGRGSQGERREVGLPDRAQERLDGRGHTGSPRLCPRRAARDWSVGTGDEIQPGQRMVISTRTRVEQPSDPLAVAEAALAGWLQGDGFVGQYETGTNRSLTSGIHDDQRRRDAGGDRLGRASLSR